MQTILKNLARLDPPAVFGISLGCVAVLGCIDYVTGHNYSFSIFYVFPVAAMIIISAVGARFIAPLRRPWPKR